MLQTLQYKSVNSENSIDIEVIRTLFIIIIIIIFMKDILSI